MALVLSFVHPLWQAKKQTKKKKIETRTHAWHIYTHPCIYEPLHHSSSFLYDSSNDNNDKNKKNPKTKQKRNKANTSLWMSCIGWTQSSHKALRGGSRIALPLTGPVVSSLQIIVPCLPERIWLGAQSPPPFPHPSVIPSFHRCLVTVVRDNGNVS